MSNKKMTIDFSTEEIEEGPTLQVGMMAKVDYGTGQSYVGTITRIADGIVDIKNSAGLSNSHYTHYVKAILK